VEERDAAEERRQVKQKKEGAVKYGTSGSLRGAVAHEKGRGVIRRGERGRLEKWKRVAQGRVIMKGEKDGGEGIRR